MGTPQWVRNEQTYREIDDSMPLSVVAQTLLRDNPDGAQLMRALAAYRSAYGQAAFLVVADDMMAMTTVNRAVWV